MIKLFPGSLHAARLMLAVAGARAGNGSKINVRTERNSQAFSDDRIGSDDGCASAPVDPSIEAAHRRLGGGRRVKNRLPAPDVFHGL